ncbi:diguanylate cyclase [Aliidiomarina sanyensis]|uniref:sensor domain-containing diguanylate cyclase n=1 Tax=Aliidiomarina sanyensis TaxID=1249555 RepID=UPI0018E580DD|nr:diguanylate cyclase [Aliidiomarina sanyensis]
MLPNRLSTRLFISLTVGLIVVFVVLVTLTLSVQQRTLRADAERLVLEFAQGQKQAIDATILVRKQALQELRNNLIRWPEPHPKLVDEAGLKVLFDSLWLISAQGEVVDTWSRQEATDGIQQLLEPRLAETLFRDAYQTNALVIAEPEPSQHIANATVHFAYGIRDEAGFHGVIVGSLTLASFEFIRDTVPIHLSQDGEIVLQTASGLILFHSEPEFIGRVAAGKAFQLADDHNETIFQGDDFRGNQSILSHQALNYVDWVVTISRPLERVYASAHRLQKIQLWVGSIVLLLTILILALLIHIQVRPLRQLGQATDAILQGKATYLPEPRLHELKKLVARFNTLLRQNESQTRALQARQAYFDTLLRTSPAGQFMTEPSGKFDYINPRLEAMTGFSFEELRATGMRVHIIDEDRPAVIDSWSKALGEGRPTEIDFRFCCKNGRIRWLHVETTPVLVDGECLGHVGSVRDVTSSHTEMETLRTQATLDALTGLLNRRGQESAFEAVFQAARAHALPVVIMLIDLDGFKEVNDQKGHAMGDEILKAVADVLRDNTRDRDIIGRLGGDEFIAVLPKCPSERALRIAKQMSQEIAAIHEKFNCPRVTASIGVTELRDTDSDLDISIARADQAAYAAKNSGRNLIRTDFLAE